MLRNVSRLCIVFVLCILSFGGAAGSAEKDLKYPHKAHFEVMEEMQDSCLLCHSFNKNTINNPKQLKAFTAIINKPMKPVCHSCHVEQKTAPATCSLCHSDKTTIWPADHNNNYQKLHGVDARHNGAECKQCHLSERFCSDCHFRRQPSASIYHPLGFIRRHGIEVQFNAAECGSCHNAGYCQDCHRSRR